MFILSLASYVLVFCFLSCVITLITKGNEASALREQYLNVQSGQTKSLPYIVYAAVAYVVIFVLSLLLPPVALALPFLHIVYSILCWVWLFETIHSGKATVWYNDIKAHFDK